MAGLFGGNEAAGLDDMRKRRSVAGRGPGYEGIGGAMVSPGQMMPYYQGLNQFDFSGAMGRDFSRQGLMSLLAEAQGPALRHFARQGFDFMPPGQDNREKPGGPNIAPGNIDNAQALDQPQGNLTPGVPQGVARGYESAPGQGVRMNPQTQGWRNIHPGYSAAAAYGSGGPEDYLQGFRKQGAPAAAAPPPGASIGGGGGRGPAAGGGGGGGAPASQNAIAGGGAPVAPGGAPGAGQGTGGGGGKSKSTGGGGGGQPGPAQTAGLSTRPGSAGPGLPGNATEANQANTIKAGVRTARKRAVSNAYEDAQNGVNNLFGNTISFGPQSGQGSKGVGPHETPKSKPGAGEAAKSNLQKVAAKTLGDKGEGKLAGLSPAEKAARKAAWQERVAQRKEAKAEKARLAAAPSASQFGTRAQGGLEPLPQAGSTRPKGSHPRGASAGRRY